ncbi:hypothetical protein NBRC110019_13710 [Neptunitalea chrysea]|uniref:Permuted papain-like amidase enzyme, YaeF/YiiX, C92 family n=2 Tax=Neptunitalea chrysea TaxID=1647581 RepID=A0A9W6B6S2_9FLAO|nr:hypothetical protein NBRC110019_13710 [Neptunitalea chrysea]
MLLMGQKITLKTGDILFRERSTNALSEAIDNVTQTKEATHYSHMGMVEVEGDSIFVLHAAPECGSARVSLEAFTHPKDDTVKVYRRVTAYRLKKAYRKYITEALEKAKLMTGKPYNYSYVMNDSSYYCSDFVYRSFEKDSIFKLNPMTFKNTKTGEFHQGWIDFYKKLGMDIPEGKPGCNPNGMAANPKLKILGVLSDD